MDYICIGVCRLGIVVATNWREQVMPWTVEGCNMNERICFGGLRHANEKVLFSIKIYVI